MATIIVNNQFPVGYSNVILSFYDVTKQTLLSSVTLTPNVSTSVVTPLGAFYAIVSATLGTSTVTSQTFSLVVNNNFGKCKKYSKYGSSIVFVGPQGRDQTFTGPQGSSQTYFDPSIGVQSVVVSCLNVNGFLASSSPAYITITACSSGPCPSSPNPGPYPRKKKHHKRYNKRTRTFRCSSSSSSSCSSSSSSSCSSSSSSSCSSSSSSSSYCSSSSSSSSCSSSSSSSSCGCKKKHKKHHRH